MSLLMSSPLETMREVVARAGSPFETMRDVVSHAAALVGGGSSATRDEAASEGPDLPRRLSLGSAAAADVGGSGGGGGGGGGGGDGGGAEATARRSPSLERLLATSARF